MESKTKTTLKIVLLTLLMTLTILLCTSVRNKLVKADYLESKPFIAINSGYNYEWQQFMSGVSYSVETYDRVIERDYILNRDVLNSNYAYLIYNLGVTQIKCNMIVTCFGVPFFDYVDIPHLANGHYFECGFVSGTVSELDVSSLANVVLPYYSTTDSFDDERDTFLGYVDTSDLSITLNGNVFFVVRLPMALFATTSNPDNYPQFLFWDLSINPNSTDYFNAGFETGNTEGYNIGYSAGVNAGYSQGYSAGADIGSEDYHIHDLLFTIFDTPLEILHNLFSFTIFSTPVWTIIVSLLALLVVLWLIKRLLT